MTPTRSHRRWPPWRRPLVASLVLLGALVLLWAGPAAAAGNAATRPAGKPALADPAPAKTLITDGSVYHDVGQAWLNITNFGLIGAPPGSFPWAGAPSLRWPGETGVDHLWAAEIWIGGVRLGERLVSDGMEIRATEDPRDVIYTMARGDPGGTRYPFGDPDDDGDGLVNEDPRDGYDNDGDGRIDEDDAIVGDQHFRAVMFDNTAGAQELYPDHTPLDLRVIQESFQWSDPRIDDFVGFRVTVSNIGSAAIDDVYLGAFADFDVPAGTPEAEDDLAGLWEGRRLAPDGEAYPLQVAWTRDGDGDPGSGVAGLLLLDHEASSFQVFKGQLPYSQGGDPTNDQERYESLADGRDPDTTVPADVRVLLAAGPFGELAPGADLVLQFALVVGADMDGMLDNAAAAAMTYDGELYPPGGGRWGPHGRRGDPGDGLRRRGGDWIHVPWLSPWEAPPPGPHAGEVAADLPTLSARPNPFNPRVELRYRLPEAGPASLRIYDLAGRLVRELSVGDAPAGEGSAFWDGADARGRPLPSGVYHARLAAGRATAVQRVVLTR